VQNEVTSLRRARRITVRCDTGCYVLADVSLGWFGPVEPNRAPRVVRLGLRTPQDTSIV